MTLPYGVISDPHYHRWDAFATTNADGLNSRLEIQLDATKEAAKAMKAAGCKHMLVLVILSMFVVLYRLPSCIS
ncbi:hypothetical protein L327_0125490 (plasmid) [Yersinia pestis S3]|nr:hypothetical protein L327_0125490 [Yersinia pestis S3]